MMNLIKLQAAIVTLVCFGSASAVFGDHVNWSSDIEASLKRANESGRLVLMKFTADWCGPCKKMERETFSQPEMSAFVNQQFVPVLVNADKHKELMQHLKITSIPTLLVVSPDMVILNRMNGFQTQAKLHPQAPERHHQICRSQSAATGRYCLNRFNPAADDDSTAASCSTAAHRSTADGRHVADEQQKQSVCSSFDGKAGTCRVRAARV